jgi:hypothetical protein
MKVDMIDALARSRSAIDHHPETLLRDPLVLGQLSGHRKNLADKASVFLFHVEQSRYMLSRYDQQVHGRPWINILNRHYRLVLIDDLTFNVTLDDVTKKTIAHVPALPLITRIPQKNDLLLRTKGMDLSGADS